MIAGMIAGAVCAVLAAVFEAGVVALRYFSIGHVGAQIASGVALVAVVGAAMGGIVGLAVGAMFGPRDVPSRVRVR